jgi:hypothetical protein
MRSTSTCAIWEWRYIESCAGGATAVIRGFGTHSLTCFYDTASGQLIGANYSDDVAGECGRDAAAGQLPACDRSPETESDECWPDAGTGDGALMPGQSHDGLDEAAPDEPVDGPTSPLDGRP